MDDCHHRPSVRGSQRFPDDSPHKGPVFISLQKSVERTSSRVSVDFRQYAFKSQFIFGVSFNEGDQHITTHLDHETHVIISHLILVYKCHK